MTTKDDLATLFHIEPTVPRLVATAHTAAIAHSAPGAGEAIAAVFNLLDHHTGNPSAQTLFVLLSPHNALRLSKLIETHATARGWPKLPEDAPPTSTVIPAKNQTN